MPTSNQDIRKQIVILGPETIRASGAGTFADIDRGDLYSVTRSRSGRAIANRMINQPTTLTITCYPQDPAYKACRRYIALRTSLPVDVPYPGSFLRADIAEQVMWTDAIPIKPGGHSGSEESGEVSFTFELVDVQSVQL